MFDVRAKMNELEKELKGKVSDDEYAYALRGETTEWMSDEGQALAALMIAKTVVEAIYDKYACPVCHGTGVERYTDAAGDRDHRVCSCCEASGYKR